MQYYKSSAFEQNLTTQGSTYPPSEVMDGQGNYIVIGNVNRYKQGYATSEWGTAAVSPNSKVPKFGSQVVVSYTTANKTQLT